MSSCIMNIHPLRDSAKKKTKKYKNNKKKKKVSKRNKKMFVKIFHYHLTQFFFQTPRAV